MKVAVLSLEEHNGHDQQLGQLGLQMHHSQHTHGGLVSKMQLLAQMMHVCCTLGSLLHQQEPAAEVTNSSSGSRPAAAAGLGREWVVLVAKSLLHISGWLQQQPAARFLQGVEDETTAPAAMRALWAAGADVQEVLCASRQGVQLLCRTEQLQRMQCALAEYTPLQLLLRCCSCAVSWLTEQLPVVGVPGGDVQQSTVRQAMQQLLEQAADASSALQGLAERLQQMKGSEQAFKMLTADKACGNSQWQQKVQQVDECWQLLHSFAAGLIDECPVSSSCCNPLCVNVGKLSERQLVSSKGCVCEGCGVARYCSKACQVKMWAKHHRRVCRRLRAPAVVSG
jgi:hypothetical protein